MERMYDTCKRCGEFSRIDTHRCPPSYLVWCADLHSADEDGRRVLARSHERAAENWAEAPRRC